MLEITRELVEHYLRATGWRFDQNNGLGWWLGTDASGNEGRGFPASWLPASGLDADVAARMAGHRVNAVTLAFRLGLCAAAEEIRLDAESQGTLYAERALNGGHNRLLMSAGIDPAAWESARGSR